MQTAWQVILLALFPCRTLIQLYGDCLDTRGKGVFYEVTGTVVANVLMFLLLLGCGSFSRLF